MPIEREYKIGASSRTCHVCGREFAVGEAYYSAVVEADPDAEEMFARHDFCSDCWDPGGGGYFSFWKTRVPEPPPARPAGPQLVDLARLMQLFEHLADADQEPAQRFRYVLALVLMRKKRLRLVSSRRVAGGRGEEVTLREVGSRRRHVVRCPSLSEDEIRSVTDRLGEVLDMPEQWDRIETGEDEAVEGEDEGDKAPEGEGEVAPSEEPTDA